MLSGAAERDLSIELFGHTLPTPVFLAPIGVLGVMTDDEHGDLATAAASAASGVPMVASTLMQDPMEEVAAALGDTPGFFQLYTPNDRELAESFVRRAEAAGFSGIVVTLDTWTLGYRPRDLQHATFPQLRGDVPGQLLLRPGLPLQARGAARGGPGGRRDPVGADLRQSRPHLGRPRLAARRSPSCRCCSRASATPTTYAAPRMPASTGSTAPTTAAGRPPALPAIDLLPAVVDAADGMPVLFDSGVRSGPDVVKALALGATAVGIGRPYGYGAALGGTAGVEFVLSCLLAEADLTMGLNGYASVADLTRDVLVRT